MKKLKACSIHPTTTGSMSCGVHPTRKCTLACRKFMSKKIGTCMRAGKSQKHAIAIGYSEARQRGCPYAKLSRVV